MADIVQIEMRRKAMEITKARLCRTAEVHVGTYRRLQKLPGSGRADTLAKLGKALDALVDSGERRHG